MAKGITAAIKLEGIKAAQKALRELPKRVEKKANKQSVNAGATPVVKAVRAQVPTRSGLVRKSVTKKVKQYSSGAAIALVGVRKDAEGSYRGKREVPAYIWHFVVGGTKAHDIPRKAGGVIHHPGAKPSNALEAGWVSAREKARQKMEAKFREVVNKEAEKLGK